MAKANAAITHIHVLHSVVGLEKDDLRKNTAEALNQKETTLQNKMDEKCETKCTNLDLTFLLRQTIKIC